MMLLTLKKKKKKLLATEVQFLSKVLILPVSATTAVSGIKTWNFVTFLASVKNQETTRTRELEFLPAFCTKHRCSTHGRVNKLLDDAVQQFSCPNPNTSTSKW